MPKRKSTRPYARHAKEATMPVQRQADICAPTDPKPNEQPEVVAPLPMVPMVIQQQAPVEVVVPPPPRLQELDVKQQAIPMQAGEPVPHKAPIDLGLKRMFETDNVFLFIPNIIDYVRAVMVVLFAYFASQGSYEIASLCYIFNVALDELDGNAARYFGQTSMYGMLLDIFIDEASVLILSVNLSIIYPNFILLFQMYTIFDILGQWSNYMFAAMYRNSKFSETEDPLLRTYFCHYWLCLLWVYGNHLFLLMLYVCHYTYGPTLSMFGVSVGLWQLLAYLAAPWSLSRLAIMVYLLATSLRNIGEYDRLKRLSTVKGTSNGNLNGGSCRCTTRNVSNTNGINLNGNNCKYTSNGTTKEEAHGNGFIKYEATTLTDANHNNEFTNGDVNNGIPIGKNVTNNDSTFKG